MSGMFGLQELLMLGVLCLPWTLMVWALVDCVRREFPGPNEKVMWVIIIVLAYCVGPLIYLAIGRPRSALPGPGGA